MKLFKHTIIVSFLFFAVICQNTNAHTHSTSHNEIGKNAIPPVSIQLWSVRDALKKDFKGTLKQISDLGFEGVEFARFYGPYENDAKGLKAYLDKLGLKTSGAHIKFDNFNDDNFDKSVAFYKTLGTDMLIIGWDERSFKDEGIEEFVAELNKLEKKLTPLNLKTGFHNHGHDMADYKQTTFWDFIATSTPKHVILQQDVGWTVEAGKDPIEYVKRYPGRTLTTHIKAMFPNKKMPHGKLPIIGKDTTDWASIIKVTAEVGGAKWLVLEQETYPNGMTSIQAVEASKKGLDAIIAKIQ